MMTQQLLTEGITTSVSPVTDVFGRLWTRLGRPGSRTVLVVRLPHQTKTSRLHCLLLELLVRPEAPVKLQGGDFTQLTSTR